MPNKSAACDGLRPRVIRNVLSEKMGMVFRKKWGHWRN